MPLRRLFMLLMMLMLALVLVLTSFTSRRTTLKAFDDVERRFFIQDMARVQNRLDEELRVLRNYAADWGARDSLYSFVEKGGSPRYDEMFDGPTMLASGMELFLIFDAERRLLLSCFEGECAAEQRVPDRLADGVERAVPSLTERSLGGAFAEILLLGDEVYLFGVAPVLMTNRRGPPQGMLLIGRALENLLPEMRENLGTKFDVLPGRPEGVPDRSAGDVRIFSGEGDGAAVWQGRGNGISIRIDVPRVIHQRGLEAVEASRLWILLTGAGILGLVLLLLDRVILRRLRKLREVSERIVAGESLALRAAEEGPEEIFALSRSFNLLLQTLHDLVMNIPDPFILADADGGITLANDAAHALLSYGTDLKGTPLSSVLVKKEDDPRAGKRAAEKDADAKEGRSVFEASFVGADGSLLPVEVHRRNFTFGARPLSLFLARDLKERKQFEERLARKAYFDDLTGLPNRHSLLKAVNRLLNDGTRTRTFSLAVINMDHFKLVNAQVGNLNGDRILLLIAEKIKALQEPEAQLFRTSGDEFALLFPLPEGGESEEMLLMDRIRKAIATPCEVGDETVFPSASIGVLADIAEGKNASGAIDAALHAVTQARKNGIGHVAWYAAPVVKEYTRGPNLLTLQAELQTALERREFIPYFQPIYDLVSEKIRGFETLARWMRKGGGMLAPGDFVPQAEHTGFISNIDVCMMEHALRAIVRAKELADSSRLFFSANGSPLFFRGLASMETVEFLIDSIGADPTLFTIEVTESALIDNLDDVHRKLDYLKSCGVKIALDDFGTGYSSLQYINHLPFDYLKLDRAFVSQLFRSEKTEHMMRTIIGLAHDLRMDIIAEGVETAEQLSWLRAAGCPKAQGFYFSRPVAWAEAEVMIRELPEA